MEGIHSWSIRLRRNIVSPNNNAVSQSNVRDDGNRVVWRLVAFGSNVFWGQFDNTFAISLSCFLSRFIVSFHMMPLTLLFEESDNQIFLHPSTHNHFCISLPIQKRYHAGQNYSNDETTHNDNHPVAGIVVLVMLSLLVLCSVLLCAPSVWKRHLTVVILPHNDDNQQHVATVAAVAQ